MNSLRLSGWVWVETCSAETTVPWITRTSRPAPITASAYRSTRCGVSEAHETTPALLDLADPLLDQLVLERLAVELLHAPGRLLVGQGGDLLVDRLGILVARPQALEVQARQPAELPDPDRGRRRDPRVHRRGHHRQPERVGVDLPGDVDVVGVPRPPARGRSPPRRTRTPGGPSSPCRSRSPYASPARRTRICSGAHPLRVDAVTPCGEGTTAVRSDRVARAGHGVETRDAMTTFT